MKKRTSGGRWLFTLLILLLVISLMPLFMMFFTSVIPQGDLFHLITERSLLDFESSPIYLRTKMKTIGTRNFELKELQNRDNKVLSITIEDPGKEYGVAAFTGDNDMNLVGHLSLYISAPENSQLYLGLKDINDVEERIPLQTITHDGLKKLKVDFESQRFETVNIGHISQIQFIIAPPEYSLGRELIVDDIQSKLKFPTLSNFITVWKEQDFARYMFNSSLISLVVVLGNLLFCSMVAYAFARKQFRGREILFSLVLATMMIPPQVTIIPVFILMKNLGWIDTYMALIFPFLVTPFGIFLMRQYIEQLPSEFDEAAYVDGASDFQIFTRIIMPLSGPAMAVLGINTFITIWNDLFYPLVMTNSKGMRTVQVGLAMYQKLNQTDWPRMMSASTIAGIPVIIIFLIFQKQIISGLVEGGVKG